MSLFDIFKKTKKKSPQKAEKIPTERKPKKIVERKQSESPESSSKSAVAVKEKKLVFGVLKNPRITEKASALNDFNQYIFEVYPQANKSQIKRAVEGFYNISVAKVRIINMPAKPRRLGRTMGKKAGFKKAVVTLKKGDKIELMPH